MTKTHLSHAEFIHAASVLRGHRAPNQRRYALNSETAVAVVTEGARRGLTPDWRTRMMEQALTDEELVVRAKGAGKGRAA